MILQVHGDPFNLSVAVEDSILEAALMANRIEEESENFFIFFQHEVNDIYVRKFLAPVVLKAQMNWVLSRGGSVILLDKEMGLMKKFWVYGDEGIPLDSLSDENPNTEIDEKIHEIISEMRHRGGRLSKTFLRESFNQQTFNNEIQFWIVAHSKLSLEDLSTIKWGWV